MPKGVKPSIKRQKQCLDCSKSISHLVTRCKSCVGKLRSIVLATRLKISESRLGEKNVNWKGDNVGYAALHTWIKKAFT